MALSVPPVRADKPAAPSVRADKPAATASHPHKAPAASPIIVGEYGSITGMTATFGMSTDHGVQLAIEQVNAVGGINGHPLQIRLYDDEGSPDTAVAVVRKLVFDDRVTAVIGEVASTRSIAAAPICNSAGVPMISPSSTNPRVTKVGPFIFRVCFIDPYQGEIGAIFAHDNLKAARAAIIVDGGQDYSMSLAQVFRATFARLGGKTVSQESYGSMDPNFQSMLRRVKATNPDVIYLPGYYPEAGAIAREAREMGITATLLGGDGWDSSRLIVAAGGPNGAMEGAYFTNHYIGDWPRATVKLFEKAYLAKYGAAPDALAAMGYDAVGVLVDALKRAGKPEDGDYASPAYRTKLRNAIAATKDFPAVAGPITIGADRNPMKPAVILQVHGDEFKFAAVLGPPSVAK
jgi:branched-chain amino acid transport system substrate-binding protein